ncbi:MAG: nucleotidyl transferase AbiEii/AbiGii toxin family protein [Planctomycetaceae bacterium]|nr:nucleotidyl transferase AbiEii/AbiGii toxin family protein [Planctomycetaceae bacterium]
MHLIELLSGLRAHPFLRDRLALKGGTALNLFLGDLPRLSVDADLNYIGGASRATMQAERPSIERAVVDVCGRLGFAVRRAPDEHAGGKWRLAYSRNAGGTGTLELDLNFLARQPLFEPTLRDSIALGRSQAREVLVLDVHDLAAGKLAALFGRSASRDLFDAHRLLQRGDLDVARLRMCFAVYAACGRRDPRELTVDSVHMDSRDAEQRLLPLLREDLVTTRRDIPAWVERLVLESRAMLAPLLPFAGDERRFLDALQERGEVRPELLTTDATLQARIHAHPGLAWKALNVRRFRGLRDAEGPSTDADSNAGDAGGGN